MQIFANGTRRFHSFIEFFVIHLKNQEVKIWNFQVPIFTFKERSTEIPQNLSIA